MATQNQVSQNTQSNETTNPQSWLTHFPIMFFASVMGIGGFTLVIDKTLRLFGADNFLWISTALTFLSVALLCGISLLYLAKIMWYYPAFLEELAHPMRINFFAAISVSILIVLMLLLRFIPLWLANLMFCIGALLQLAFSLYIVRFWFVNAMQQKMANPAWFIPIVGNLIVPLAGVNLNLQGYLQGQNIAMIPFEVLIFYFGMGSFFWILLNAALLIRLVFGENLPQKFLPTLFIFIAPPSVFALDVLALFSNYVSSASLYGIASASFSIALFFMFLMISLSKVFMELKFALSWWAFTFPTAAFTLCALELFIKGDSAIYAYLGIFGIVLSGVMVLVVTFYTLLAIWKKEICMPEE